MPSPKKSQLHRPTSKDATAATSCQPQRWPAALPDLVTSSSSCWPSRSSAAQFPATRPSGSTGAAPETSSSREASAKASRVEKRLEDMQKKKKASETSKNSF